jgi:hypothetical protein
MQRIILISLIVFGFSMFSEDIFGQAAYKSVDERGTINFSDNPTSSVLETKKGPRKEDGAEVLKRNEKANLPPATVPGGKTIVLDHLTSSGGGSSSGSSGGSSRTIRTGRS